MPKGCVHARLFPRDLVSCTPVFKYSSQVHTSQGHTSGPSMQGHALVLPPESSCGETPAPCALSLCSLCTPPRGNGLLSPLAPNMSFACLCTFCVLCLLASPNTVSLRRRPVAAHSSSRFVSCALHTLEFMGFNLKMTGDFIFR